jgi:radical SAM protein with 4Fe4S-binding SPASM domain
MDPTVRTAYDASRRIESNNFRAACYAPFVSMFFTTSGNVVACCKSQSLSVGNVTSERLDAIWNGPRVENFRKMVRAYVLPSECGFCAWQISSGDYAGVFTQHFDQYGADDTKLHWPKVMEFAISNECNLECIMCSGDSSSRIRARREHLPPLANAYGDEFFADLRKYLPHLQLAKFLGGEPFLIQGNFRIWDMMIEDGLATPCIITTNGTLWDEKVERVLDHLPVSIVFSIDGATAPTLETIRLGAKYDVLMTNARRFIDYTRRRGTSFNFIFSLMRQNWREFADFLLLAESMGVRTETSTVVYPPQHSVFTLPPKQLLEMVETMERRDAELGERLKLNLPVWRATLTSLRKNATDAQTSAAGHILEDAAADATFAGLETADHFARANALAHQGRVEEAIAAALKATKRDVGFYPALVLAGRLLRDLGRVEEAQVQFDRAIAAAPARADAYVERGWLRHRQMRVAEGIADVEKAHQLMRASPAPALEHALCGLAGILFVNAGRYDDARVAIDRLFALQPDAALSYVRRGWVWQAAGRPAEALADAQAALARDAQLATAHDLERSARQELGAAAPVRE